MRYTRVSILHEGSCIWTSIITHYEILHFYYFCCIYSFSHAYTFTQHRHESLHYNTTNRHNLFTDIHHYKKPHPDFMDFGIAHEPPITQISSFNPSLLATNTPTYAIELWPEDYTCAPSSKPGTIPGIAHSWSLAYFQVIPSSKKLALEMGSMLPPYERTMEESASFTL